MPTITDMIAKTLTTILEVQETFRAKCDKDRVGILYDGHPYKKLQKTTTGIIASFINF